MFYHYPKETYCMEFSNKEKLEYFAEPFENHPEIDIRVLNTDGEEIPHNTNENIEFICFDGKIEDFYIRFINSMTLIYQCNEEFMFIDEIVKEQICSCDTYHNVVFEGILREKTHKKILELLYEIVNILLGATAISIKEDFVSREGLHYPKYSYTINLTKNNKAQKKHRIENILFIVNEPKE